MNSRYRPGEVTDEWLQISTARAARAVAGGPPAGCAAKKVLHIEDDGNPNVERSPRI